MLAGESWRSIIIEMCDCSSESPPPLGRDRDPSVRTDTSQKERFIKACERGEKQLVLFVLENGTGEGTGAAVNINYRDKNGASALLRACWNGELEIVKILHKYDPSSIVVKDDFHCRATHYAAEGGCVHVLKFLHVVGFREFNQRNKIRQTPLHFATKNGHYMAVEYLLQVQGADVTVCDWNGDTPLHIMFYNILLVDYFQLLDLLLQHTANINAQNKRGQTPLHLASMHNLVAGARALIEHGADPNIVDKNGVSPIIGAAENGCEDVIPLLHSAGASVNSKDNSGRTPFHAACSEGHSEVVKVLVTLKASQSSQDKGGNIPLQLACHRGQVSIAKYLVETGLSDVHSLDRNGQAPIYKACKGKDSNDRSRLLQYLIAKGANVNLQSKYRRSPLHCACEDGNPEAARLLLRAGADVTVVDRDHQTPLHYASFGGFSKFPTYNQVVDVLLHHKADPNQKGDKGMTAVHIASMRGNVDALKLLLYFGGNPNMKCQNGLTAVHYSVRGDPPKAEPSFEAVKLLLDHGADPNEADNISGNTPLHYAAIEGRCDFLQLILKSGIKEMKYNRFQQQAEDVSSNASVRNMLMVAKMEFKYTAEEIIPLPFVKLFLTGHSMAGKTALRHNLGNPISCKPRESSYQREEKYKERTAGIEVENLEHQLFGAVVAYDLAGHCEYTTSHSVVIDCGSNSIFLILYNITHSLQQARKEVNYWAAFIKAGRIKGSQPHVFLVATHSDSALKAGKSLSTQQMMHSCVCEEIKERYGKAFSLKEGQFIINCLESKSERMNQLRETVGLSCERIKRDHPKVPTVSLMVLKEMKTMCMEEQKPLCTDTEVIKTVLHRNNILAGKEEQNPGMIATLLKYLSAMGMILLLQNWVVIDVEGVLGDILGVIFAPDGFYTEDLSQCKQGFLPLTRINALFGHTYGSDVVITLLTELKLGVLQHESIQVPALLRGCKRTDNSTNVYIQYTGIRFKLRSETDIISCSTFPKIQVRILQQYGGKVQLWTHGLCCIVDGIHVTIYMSDNKQYIDVVVRSQEVNGKRCYNLRQMFRRKVEEELLESSPGNDFDKQLIRPEDLKNNTDSCIFTTYNVTEVYEQFTRNESTITSDGQHTDSIQELLFCNYLPLQDVVGQELSEKMLQGVAREIVTCSTSWILLGAELGLEKEVLDCIDVNSRHRNEPDEYAAYEMLWRARESCLLLNTGQLVRACENKRSFTLAWKLALLFGLPIISPEL